MCAPQLGAAVQNTFAGGQYRSIYARSITFVMALWLASCASPVVRLGARGGSAGRPPDRTPASNDAAVAVTPADAGVTTVARAPDAAGGNAAGMTAGAPASTGAGAGRAAAGEPALPMQPSPGCGAAPPTGDGSLQLNGSTASYSVEPASAYDPNRAYPLIVTFRGANVTAAAFRRYLSLSAVVGADGIVVNADCADNGNTWDLQRDLPFFDALIAKLQSQYCIDPRRIYVVGHTTGAVFANAVACLRGGTVRALGSLSGAAPSGMCTGQVAAWVSQGTGDPGLTLGRATRDFWVGRNACSTSMSAVEPAPCVEFAGCAAGAVVRYCEYDGDLGVPAFATAGLWSFFKTL